MDASYLNTPCKHCLTYCRAHILQGELQSFVRSWNSHPIHKNHLTRVPSGVPEDLYYLPHRQGRILTVLDHQFAVMHNSISGSFTMIPHTYIGTQNYQCDVDRCVWLAAYSLAKTPEEFYPVEFAGAASAVLRRGFGIEQNAITIDIAYNVFIFLVDEMEL